MPARAVAQGAVASTSTSAAVQGAPAMVIVVRHGEKASVGGSDPSLSEAGQARAKALSEAIAAAGVTAIITTTLKRTVETAQPFATEHHIAIEQVPNTGDMPKHLAALTAAVRKHRGEVVLIVGHSNTVPAIVNALGGPKLPDLCDAAYATMFLLIPSLNGKSAHVVRSTYGLADANGAESCSAPPR